MEENVKNKKAVFYIVGGIIALILAIILIPKLIGIFNKAGNAKPVSYNITLTASGFEPKEISIKKGDVIVWTNNSGKQASINSADQPDHQKFPFLNLGLFENGQTKQTPFNGAGTFEYVNHLNPKDTGIVTVK